MSTDNTNGWDGTKASQIMRYRATIMQILEDTPKNDTWVARQIDAPQNRRHGALIALRQQGAVKVAERQYYTERVDGNRSGRRRNKYRWADGVREKVADTVYSCDTFPDCEHKVHVYNPRGSDAETLACKECGEKYDKETVRKLL